MSTTPLKTLLEQLLEAGQRPDPALLRAIQEHGQAAVSPLIEIVTDPNLLRTDSDAPEVWAPMHAMRLLGRLRATAAIAPLITLVEEEEADWIREELPDVMAQIGPTAVEPLKAFAADRQQDLYARSAACNGLSKIAQAHPETRQQAIAFLRILLSAYPDETPDDETMRGFVIGDLLDLGAREAYPDIEAAYGGDRVDEMIVGLDTVQRELDIRGGAEPRKRAEFELRLKCLECGFTRSHAVDVVYCDLGTQDKKARGQDVPYSAFIIPQQITCPRCGAVDRYELGGEAHLTLIAELLKLVMPGRKTPGLGEGTGHLRLMTFTVEGGQHMHPLEALEMYRRRVEKKPRDAGLRLRYANVLRFLGRWDEAQAQYDQVKTLDPRNTDVYYALAQMAEWRKDPESALALYEAYLARAPQRPKGRQDREAWDYAQEFVQTLRRQQAGVLGRVVGAVGLGRAGRAGARLIGPPPLPVEPDPPPRPRARPQDKNAARKAEKQARKAQRRSKKRKGSGGKKRSR